GPARGGRRGRGVGGARRRCVAGGQRSPAGELAGAVAEGFPGGRRRLAGRLAEAEEADARRAPPPAAPLEETPPPSPPAPHHPARRARDGAGACLMALSMSRILSGGTEAPALVQ